MDKWRVEKSRMYPHFMCPWETISPGGQYLVWISWGEAMKHVNDKIMEKKITNSTCGRNTATPPRK